MLAEVQNPCLCGAQNCPYYVVQLTPGHPVLIDGVRSRSPLRLTVYDPRESMDIKAGVPYTLPRNATFRLHIDNGAESDVPYALTFAIRYVGSGAGVLWPLKRT